MHTIKNLTNSPHKIKLADGSEGRVPARGEGTFSIHPKWLGSYQNSGYLLVSEATKATPTTTAKPDPLDHDVNGKKGGSLKAAQTGDLKALRAEYERVVGKRPFGGWDAKELRSRLAAAQKED